MLYRECRAERDRRSTSATIPRISVLPESCFVSATRWSRSQTNGGPELEKRATFVAWLGPRSAADTHGAAHSAHTGLITDHAWAELAGSRPAPIPWTLNAIVRHALVPLAEYSLADGQPMTPEFGGMRVAVLADPHLRPSQGLLSPRPRP